MKKIIIVLCVLFLSACGGGGKVNNTKVTVPTEAPATVSTIVPGTVECIRIDHPEGQQEWTDIQHRKYGTFVTHHYKYYTESCFTHK